MYLSGKKPQQIDIHRQRSNEQQRILSEVSHKNVPQNNRVSESNFERTDFDAGTGLVRYDRYGLLGNGMLNTGNLQHNHGNDDQTQYAGKYPRNKLDGAADVRFGLFLFYGGIGDSVLLFLSSPISRYSPHQCHGHPLITELSGIAALCMRSFF